MLSYWLNNEPLALGEDAKIRLTWNNPFATLIILKVIMRLELRYL